MKFLVITNAPSLKSKLGLEAYAPYVVEMDIWFNNIDEIKILSPIKYPFSLNIKPFKRQNLKVLKVPFFYKIKFLNIVLSPFVILKIFTACLWADHIHLRCPGNIGLLGCLVQILFPHKPKTAKYAGNWDPKAKQPLSYRLQKWILNNRFLTRNMRVLVYGEWPGASKNILPFFTATYSENEKTQLPKRTYSGCIGFVFAGSLTENKHPMIALRFVHQLQEVHHLTVRLDFYGDGPESEKLSDFIKQNKLEESVKLHGNQPKEVLKKAYQTADFLLLPSQSEGWPKAVAEAMFWGAIPIVSAVSCVPWMLGFGERGLFFDTDLSQTTQQFISVINNPDALQKMAESAANWSQNYTLETFESEIQKLLKPQPS